MSYSQVGRVPISCLWSLVSSYTVPDMPACEVRSMRSYGSQTKTRSWFSLSKKILNEKMQACQEWSHQWVSSHYHTAHQQIAMGDLIRLEADPTSPISMNKTLSCRIKQGGCNPSGSRRVCSVRNHQVETLSYIKFTFKDVLPNLFYCELHFCHWLWLQSPQSP
jgi:hypothetical protein